MTSGWREWWRWQDRLADVPQASVVCVCVCVNPKNSSLTSSILEFWFTGSIWRDVTAQVTFLLPDHTLGSRLDFYDPVSPFPVNNEHKALIDTDSRWSRCTERYHAILGREPKYTKSRQNFKTIFACELAGCFFFFVVLGRQPTSLFHLRKSFYSPHKY